MWRKFNPNPCGRSVGDCAVRAVAVALGVSWEEAFDMLADAAFKMCDMQSSNSVIGAVLRMNGFQMAHVPEACTIAEYVRDHPNGIKVLFTTGHVATAIGENVYDAWDSTNEYVQFVWYRKER